MMKTEFRQFRATDTADVITLLKTVLPDNQPHNDPDVVLEEKARIDNLSFVATLDGQVCGFVMAGYDGHRGWLYQLAVEPSVRRKGIATGLVTCATAHLQQLGCVKLNLQVREENIEAESLYESLGFVREPRISMGKLL